MQINISLEIKEEIERLHVRGTTRHFWDNFELVATRVDQDKTRLMVRCDNPYGMACYELSGSQMKLDEKMGVSLEIGKITLNFHDN